LFGTPQAIALDQAVLRDSGRCDDWFQARLCYPGRRVVLRASMLAAAASPRFVVHGTRGSWVKQGLDPQEEALKAGARPTWPAAPGWGADRQPSLLTRAGADALRTEPLPLCCGGHGAFYAALRDALQGLGDNPVPASQACAVMAWLELGQRSAREGRECGAEAPEGLDTSGIAPG